MSTDQPWRVGELLDAAGQVLDALGPGPCWVSGTLTSWRTSRAFGWGELIEHSGDGRRQLARLPIAVPWRVAQDARRALAATGVTLGDGIDVTIHGCLEVHPHYGPLRFLVDRVAVSAAPGAAREARRALIDRLDTEGLLRLNRSCVLTEVARVGLVVPATGGAGRADFIGRLVAAGGPFQILEQRAATQGTEAAAEIARAVHRLAAEHVDVIVVARGGGATGDLAAFDSEPVALAIATAPVPVVVAVGHSTDHTVADEVAHTTLATPTAAAEWLLQLTRGDEQLTSPIEPTVDWLRQAASEFAARLAAEERLRASRRQTAAVAVVALFVALLLVLVL